MIDNLCAYFMKKVFMLVLVLGMMVTATWAQTPREIVSRMETVMKGHGEEGFAMSLDIKIPVLGAIRTKFYVLGRKMRVEGRIAGTKIVSWSDGVTSWRFNERKNELEIKNSRDSLLSTSERFNALMFKDVTEGYDVIIKKETEDTWQLQCKKSKTNKDNDVPKNMTLVIAKGSYCLVSMSTKMFGVTVYTQDISFGVSEQTVTFNPKDYPGVTVIDKRLLRRRNGIDD